MNDPKLTFLSPEFFGEGVRVDVVNTGTDPRLTPFKASKITVYPGQWSPIDKHEVKECWLIASGIGKLIYDNDAEQEVNPGDVLYYDSFKSHKVYNHGKEELIIFSIWWNAH